MNLPMIFERKGIIMDDLISRKLAIEAVKIPDDGCSNPSERHGIIFARVEARRAIQSIPSVPAVPLDKLCEWLAGNAWHLDCSDCDGEYCDCTQLHDDSGSSPAFWKAKLTKWMEEQDAIDRCRFV